MAILLPSTPGIRAAQPALISYGTELRPFMGGPSQQINRLGDRFAITVEMPPIEAEPWGRRWVARLLRAKREGAIFPWPHDVPYGAATNGTVATAAAGGSTLAVGGVPAAYTWREGQWVSLIVSGKRYLHMVTGDVTADGNGAATLGLFPLLRVSVPQGATVEVSQPKIEGFIDGNATAWTVEMIAAVGVGFTIREAA